MTKRNIAIPILALALLANGCATRAVPGTPQADPIVRIAAALDKISIAAAAGTDIVILLASTGQLKDPSNTPTALDLDTESTKRRILEVFKKLVEARIAAGGIVRDLNKLDTIDKTKLGELLRPAFAAFRKDSTLALVGIKNPDAKAKVLFYLSLIDTAIGAIEFAMDWRQ